VAGRDPVGLSKKQRDQNKTKSRVPRDGAVHGNGRMMVSRFHLLPGRGVPSGCGPWTATASIRRRAGLQPLAGVAGRTHATPRSNFGRVSSRRDPDGLVSSTPFQPAGFGARDPWDWAVRGDVKGGASLAGGPPGLRRSFCQPNGPCARRYTHLAGSPGRRTGVGHTRFAVRGFFFREASNILGSSGVRAHWKIGRAGFLRREVVRSVAECELVDKEDRETAEPKAPTARQA